MKAPCEKSTSSKVLLGSMILLTALLLTATAMLVIATWPVNKIMASVLGTLLLVCVGGMVYVTKLAAEFD